MKVEKVRPFCNHSPSFSDCSFFRYKVTAVCNGLEEELLYSSRARRESIVFLEGDSY